MPIHFRCTSCDRMLSIARRKAGQQVSCPKCGKSVSVPAVAGVAVNSDPHAQAANLQGMPLFERSDFEELLNPALKAAKKAEPSVAVKETSQPHPVLAEMLISKEGSGEMEVMEVDGIVISRSRMTILAIVIALLLAVSFAVGYFLAAAMVGKKAV